MEKLSSPAGVTRPLSPHSPGGWGGLTQWSEAGPALAAVPVTPGISVYSNKKSLWCLEATQNPLTITKFSQNNPQKGAIFHKPLLASCFSTLYGGC